MLTIAAPASAQDPFLGEVRLFGFNFCPQGWTSAAGQLMPIDTNAALFALYGTTYGGNGRTTFALPDLRGRGAISHGAAPGLPNYPIGQAGGSTSFSLSVANLAAHNHDAVTDAALNATLDMATTDMPGDAVVLANADGTDIYGTGANGTTLRRDAITATPMVDNTGGNDAVNYRGPYLSMNWCVALVGIYPSRP